MIDSGIWTPICPVCRTETITALHGQHRCLDCGKIWDGSERDETDGFSRLSDREQDAADETLTAILNIMWNRGMIEPGVGDRR